MFCHGLPNGEIIKVVSSFPSPNTLFMYLSLSLSVSKYNQVVYIEDTRNYSRKAAKIGP